MNYLLQILIFKIIIIAIIGYLIGSINTSLILCKFYKIDIREHGSKSAGMTNALRILGKKAALIVTLGDISKGVLSCIMGSYILGTIDNIDNIGVMIAGITAVLGHNFPVYFKFKGGKGILTTFAVILIINWKIGLILFGIFLIIVLSTRYVSLGSIIGSIAFPIISIVYKEDFIFIIGAFILAISSIIMHSANIKRLLKKKENKLQLKFFESKN